MSNPNLVVVDELNGADSRGGLGRFTIRNAVVHEAAVGERLGWQRCTKCDGRGEWYRCRRCGIEHETAPTKQCMPEPGGPCPDCVGGWTPPAELAERVKKRLNVSPRWRKLTDDEARAVLLEQARWIGEQ